MVAIIDVNPSLPYAYGYEGFHAGGNIFTMSAWGNVWAFKVKTPNWSSSKTVDAIRLYAAAVTGTPKWMIQFFANDIDDQRPSSNTLLGQMNGATVSTIHRAGLTPVAGWNRWVVTNNAFAGGLTSTGYPTTPATVVFQPNSEYWVLIAPQRDLSEGYSNSNSKNYARVKFHRFNKFLTLMQTVTAISTNRSLTWKLWDWMPPFVFEFTDTTKEGFPYAFNSAGDSYKIPYGGQWIEVSNDYSQCQVLTWPSGVGSVQVIDLMAMWGTATQPTDDLRLKVYPTSTGVSVLDIPVVKRDNATVKKTGTSRLNRIRVTLDSLLSLTVGTQYVFELYSTTNHAAPWRIGAAFLDTTDAVITALKFSGGSTSHQQYRFRGGSRTDPTTFWSDLQFTLATVPTPIGGVAATYFSVGRFNRVTWNTSSDAKHAYYKVFRKVHGTSNWDVLADKVQATQFDDYAIAGGARYDYGVADVRG